MKFAKVLFLLGLSFLIALAVYIQIYPQELKSLLVNGIMLDWILVYSFLLVFVVIFTILFSIIKFALKSSHESSIKALLPLLLLTLLPLKFFFIIGNQITWFSQTDFYFIIFFILILSWTVYKLATIINTNLFSFLKKLIGKHSLMLLFSLFVFINGYFSILRLLDLTIEKPDLHVTITTLWNTTHDNILQFTYLDRPRHWFSLHFEPLLFIFVPLYITKTSMLLSPILLQLIQVLIGVSGIFPIFLLTKHKLKSEFLGFIFVLVYLFISPLQFQILYDFHIEIISLVAILWSIYLLERKQYHYSILFLLLAIAAREEFALYASIFGFFLLFKGGYSKKIGFILAPSGLFYFLFVKFVLIPYFAQNAIAPAQESMFTHLGTNFFQIIQTLIIKPDYVFNFMFTQRKIQYIFLMFLSTGFFALFSPIVLFTVPFFAINLLLDFDLPSSIFWHYQSWLLPIFLWANIDFISKRKKAVRNGASLFVLSAVFLSSLYFGPTDILKFDLGTTHKPISDLKQGIMFEDIQQTRSLIPQEASLASDTGLAPFFADRKDFYLFPDNAYTDFIVTSVEMLLGRLPSHKTLMQNGYCLRNVRNILIYKKARKCGSEWQNDLIEKKFTLTVPKTIYPTKLNQPKWFNIKASVKEKPSKNSFYFIDYQILAFFPNIVKMYASSDSRTFKLIAVCSAFSDSYCIAKTNVSSFINKNGAIFLQLYLVIDDRVSKIPKEIQIDQISLVTLKLKKTNGLDKIGK